MKTIVLISCCKQKLKGTHKAKELYISAGFKKSLAYAESLNPDSIYILSALYGLVELNQELKTYDKCLNDETSEYRKAWSEKVLCALREKANLREDKFIILTGKSYYENLLSGISHYELPLEGLRSGERLQWFDRNTVKTENDLCKSIHEFANSLPRFDWTFKKEDIPENGIYFFFEKGEKYCSMDRIVRVGTHTGEGNLFQRLSEHLKKENKDRSIFRKNIGRALLNKRHDDFLKIWDIDFTKAESRKSLLWNEETRKRYDVLEKEITEYMHENLTFSVIPVDNKDERLDYEDFLIRSISENNDNHPSDSWPGNFSPVEKIRKSGMWVVNGLSRKFS